MVQMALFTFQEQLKNPEDQYDGVIFSFSQGIVL